MNMNCAIVDDEYLSRKLLKNYVANASNLKLVGDFNSPFKVLELLVRGEVDILFLDNQMLGLKGLEILRNFEKQPEVILTTAYNEYTFDTRGLNVVDYLLKPFSFERFLNAVKKANTNLEIQQIQENPPICNTHLPEFPSRNLAVSSIY